MTSLAVDRLLQRVRPAAQSAWETTSDTSRTLYRSSSDKAGQLWEAAGPTAQYYADYTKVRLRLRTQSQRGRNTRPKTKCPPSAWYYADPTKLYSA